MIKIVTVIGARPQFIKAAALSRKITEKYSGRVHELIVHTGQHYDQNMSDVFFEEMKIPRPHRNLEVGSGSHGAMTGRMLEKIEQVLLEEQPDYLLTYGDTNSTIAGALAASKLHIPVVHVEAGLRSFNMKMPEEQNRILTDHISSYLFCPTDSAVQNLENEGITRGVHRTGDIMLDASLFYRQFIKPLSTELPADFVLATLHRAENTDDPQRLASIVRGLNECGRSVVLPLHPRTVKMLEKANLRFSKSVVIIEPVGYFEMLYLEQHCSLVVTDSGGVQKEAYFFGKPCVTMRDQTEWVETVNSGWNTLVGADESRIRDAVKIATKPQYHPDLYGSGNSAEEMLTILLGE